MSREIIFVRSRVWTAVEEAGARWDGEVARLHNPSLVVTGEGPGGKRVPVFSDDDLARRFAEAGGSNHVAALIERPHAIVAFLEAMRGQGCTLVALDPDLTKTWQNLTPIDEAIRDVRQNYEPPSEHPDSLD
jgi:hypothetical protein